MAMDVAETVKLKRATHAREDPPTQQTPASLSRRTS